MNLFTHVNRFEGFKVLLHFLAYFIALVIFQPSKKN